MKILIAGLLSVGATFFCGPMDTMQPVPPGKMVIMNAVEQSGSMMPAIPRDRKLSCCEKILRHRVSNCWPGIPQGMYSRHTGIARMNASSCLKAGYPSRMKTPWNILIPAGLPTSRQRSPRRWRVFPRRDAAFMSIGMAKPTSTKWKESDGNGGLLSAPRLLYRP